MYKPGDSYHGEFLTWLPSSNAAIDADALPTAKMSRNGVDDNTVTVTVVDKGVGRYSVAATIPVGYAVGDEVYVSVFYAIGLVAMTQIVDSFQLDNTQSLLSSVNSLLAALVNPDIPNIVTYYGYSEYGDGRPVQGREVLVSLVSGPQNVGNAMIETNFPVIETAYNGRWEVGLTRGKQFQIRIPEENIDLTVTVSTNTAITAVNIKDALGLT
jgi:hypothetical protein